MTRVTLIALLCWSCSIPMPAPLNIIKPTTKWVSVNDDVMGGISSGKMQIVGKIGVFSGTLSPENNGGFASVRTQVKPISNEYFKLRVRGDGKTYQLRARTSYGFDGISYKAEFPTTSDEWMEISIPVRDFIPVFRGRRIQAAPLAAADIVQLGFLISGKQYGAFRLEVESLLVQR